MTLSVEELLAQRRPDAPLPPSDLLARASLGDMPAPDPRAVDWMAQAAGGQRLAGRRIAVDLDDTLLHNSQTCRPLWDLGGYYDRAILPGYRYAALSTSAIGWLRALRGRPAYDRISRPRHPFMANPRIIAAPNLPLLQMLVWLKGQGVHLALATASARARVDLLRARLPLLDALFGTAVLSAEDLAARALAAEAAAEETELWQRSAPVHRARPRSLVTKTPWALAPAFAGAGYDLLIDDSAETARLFTAHGLDDHLLAIDGHAVAPAQAWATVAACLARLTGRRPPPLPAGLAEATPVIRFEDPLYWPYLHLKDTF